ncbi:MAG: tetratricopeptide repeat protein [Gemmatimonadales bacterium]
MRARCLLVAAVAVLLFLPTVRYGFVQDDRAIIALNPAVQSIPAALLAFDDPYWPFPSQAGLYRPLTILSFAVDWQLSGGAPGWFHIVNALLHVVAAVLVVLVLARWLPPTAAAIAGLVFAVHPVHVEGVAGLVGRAEILVAIWVLATVLLARRGAWAAAVLCAMLAMLSKEHGVITGVVVLLDNWLQSPGVRRWYPKWFYGALAVATVAYLAVWAHIGIGGAADDAAPFIGAGTVERLAVALPILVHAGRLLVWPVELSADYSPQVIPIHSGLTLAAVAGALLMAGVVWLIPAARRRAPALSFAAGVAALAYLPTSNLLMASAVMLAERTLYLPVLLVAAGVGAAAAWALARRPEAQPRRVWLWAGMLGAVLFARSFARLPVWRSNKEFLLTTLREHPESYRAHIWAASVLAGIGDTAEARREYARADSLFSGDPALAGARALFLAALGDTSDVARLVERARRLRPGEPRAMRARMLLLVERADRVGASAFADSVRRRFPWEAEWYIAQLQRLD